MARRTGLIVLLGVIAIIIVMVSSATSKAAGQSSSAGPNAPQDTPTVLVTDRTAEWTVGGGMIYWYLDCNGSEIDRHDGFVRRQPSHGGISITLTTIPQPGCLAQLSRFVADDGGVYDYESTTHHIESRPAGSPYDPPTVLYTPTLALQSRLVIDGDYLYYLSAPDGTGKNRIYRAAKDGSALSLLKSITNTNATDLIVDHGSIYWLDNGGLWTANTSCPGPFITTCDLQLLVPGARGQYLLYQGFSSGFLVTGYTVLWVDTPVSGAPRIRRYGCDTLLGCSTSTLYTAPTDFPWQIGQLGLHGSDLYWPEGYISGINQDGRIRHRTSGGAVSTIAINTPYSARTLYTDDLGVYFLDVPGISRLPFDASALVFNLAFDSWEVTQGIQNVSNDVPLVANKPTYVRVYGHETSGPSAGSVEAYLSGERGGVPLPGSPLMPLWVGFFGNVRTLAPGMSNDRALPETGWMFQLPASWISAGTITLTATIDPRGVYNDPYRGDNAHSDTYSFVDKPPLCLDFVPVDTYSPRESTSNPNFWLMIDRFKRLYPVPDVRVFHQDMVLAKPKVCWALLVPYPCTEPFLLPGDGSSLLNWLWVLTWHGGPSECKATGSLTKWVAMIHDSTPTGSQAGLARHEDPVSWVKFPSATDKPSTDWNWPSAATTLAQEVGHNFDRYHVNCPIGGPANIDPSYPYPPCQLDNSTPTAHYGFDVNTRTPIAPTAAKDFMSYAAPAWVSDYTYRALFGLTRMSAPVKAPQRPAVASLVLASGVVTPSLNQGTLYPAWILPASVMDALPSGGEPITTTIPHAYHLRLVAPDGLTTVDDQPITPTQDSGHYVSAAVGFHLMFPAPISDVTRLDLMDGANVLAQLQPSLTLPIVNVMQPANGDVISDSLTVVWQAADSDPNDQLAYVVDYSADNGQNWQTIVADYTAPFGTHVVTLTIPNATGIPKALQNSGLIRVYASDGYHTGYGTSQPFTVLDRPPQPYIVSPYARQILPAGQSIVVRGGANDLEDGALTDQALLWLLKNQPIGSGEEQRLDGLAPGSYPLALLAQDSDGITQTAEISFTIDQLYVPLRSAPALDGVCDDAAYHTGLTLQLSPYADGSQATAHLLHTATDLWVCFSGMQRGNGSPASAGVLVDVNNSRDPLVQSTDYGFGVGEDGTPFTSAGNGQGGFVNGPGGVRARISADHVSWNAELVISGTLLGGWNHLAGLNFFIPPGQQNNGQQWPYAAIRNQPVTWAQAFLGDQHQVFLPIIMRSQ